MPISRKSASVRTNERTNDDMNDKNGSRSLFRGYAGPNYTPVPDELFDEQLPDLSGAELKVLLYVIRRTFGFKRESDNISLSQMLNGLRRRDGRVLDRGVGLSKKTLLQAIKSLEEQNIILTERRRSPEKGDEPTSYRLHVRSVTAVEELTPPVGEKLHHGGGGRSAPPPWGKNSPTQETVVQQTDFDLSNFERQRQVQIQEEDPIPARGPGGNGQNPTEHQGLMSSVASVLRSRAPSATTRAATLSKARVQNDRTGASEERERLRAFLADFAAELGDEAPLASSITRTLNIFNAAAVPPERWGDLLYQARGLTQEHTAQIRKTVSGKSDQLRRKNKMPYFLATLEQLVGLRPSTIAAARERDRST